MFPKPCDNFKDCLQGTLANQVPINKKGFMPTSTSNMSVVSEASQTEFNAVNKHAEKKMKNHDGGLLYQTKHNAHLGFIPM